MENPPLEKTERRSEKGGEGETHFKSADHSRKKTQGKDVDEAGGKKSMGK